MEQNKPLQFSLLDHIKEHLSNSKIDNIEVFEVKNNLTNYVLVGTGTSTRHVRSSAEKLIDVLEPLIPSMHISGMNTSSGWILIDLNEIIIHLCTDEIRQLYKFEEIYKR